MSSFVAACPVDPFPTAYIAYQVEHFANLLLDAVHECKALVHAYKEKSVLNNTTLYTTLDVPVTVDELETLILRLLSTSRDRLLIVGNTSLTTVRYSNGESHYTIITVNAK